MADSRIYWNLSESGLPYSLSQSTKNVLKDLTMMILAVKERQADNLTTALERALLLGPSYALINDRRTMHT